jgi:hypothetical protein
MRRQIAGFAIKAGIAVFLFAGIVGAAGDTRANRSATRVDSFSLAERQVVVDFYDPHSAIEAAHPGFASLQEEEKFRLWSAHLHKVALYVFRVERVKSEGTGAGIAFVLRGNPAITDSASFYQIEIVDLGNRPLGNPNQDGYEESILARIPAPGLRGSLFEHMLPENERKSLTGAGIKLYGKFVRITPYSDVKSVVSRAIEEYFGRKSEIPQQNPISPTACSFLVRIEGGGVYRLIPDMEKLGATMALLPESIQPKCEQFKKAATERIAAESKRKPTIDVLDIGNIVFSRITGKEPSGESFRPMEYRIKDYAKIDKIE